MTALVRIPYRRQHFHRPGSWLPDSSPVLLDWVAGVVKEAEHKYRERKIEPHPAVDELDKLVQSNTQLRMLASAMLDEVPNKEPYINDPNGTRQIRNWDQLLCTFSYIMAEVAPIWNKTQYDVGLIGFPFNAILDWPMATQSGYGFFLNPQVNEKLKVILDTWSQDVLQTSVSQKVITTDECGWLSEAAQTQIAADTNVVGKPLTFQELFECDPDNDPEHWGFQSWDDFFVRKFRDMDKLRPIAYKDDSKWIVSACESKPYSLQTNVKELDTFWLKGQPYSVLEMLDHKQCAQDFVGGTVYQAFLSATSYHRWNSPVMGKVIDATVIPGTYFSEPTLTGFTNPEGPDPAAPDHAQGYITHVATRAIFLIDAGPELGYVCTMFVGMADVSTCEILDKFSKENLPVPVEKGEELGMFHHGGSTYCLLFQKGVKLAWVSEACPSTAKVNVPVRSALAYAYFSEPEDHRYSHEEPNPDAGISASFSARLRL